MTFTMGWTFSVVHVYSLFGLLFLSWTQVYSTEDRLGDYRIIQYSDLVQYRDVMVYSHPQVDHYLRLLLDPTNKQIIVGARNYLLRLSLNDLQELEVIPWKPEYIHQQICQAKGKSLVDCQNYVKLLLVHQDRVLTCGTNAYKPICTWRQVSQMSEVLEKFSGLALSPYSRQENNTYVMTADGSLYSGTYLDFLARDPAIYRVFGPNRRLRTMKDNSRWLNEPHFVSSYEMGEHIYFFLRETAVEYINCGKRVYSRVARMCKQDAGGSFLLEENWTTFVKARLNCSLPGKFPFYFDELQSTYVDKEQGLIYATFTTPENSIPGSAVCVYNMSAVHTAFAGPFKFQENPTKAWRSSPNFMSPHMQCPNNKRAAKLSDVPHQGQLLGAQKFQMMDMAVQPIRINPVMHQANERWTHVVVDKVKGKHHRDFDVLFVSTLEGIIKKVTHIPGKEQPCLIEEIHTVPADKPQPIKSLEISKEQGILIIGTKHNIVRIPLQRCHRFTSRATCMGSMDPYCGWDSQLKQCTPRPDGPVHDWHQDIKGCPNLSFPVNGKWSQWSKWSLCKQVGQGAAADSQCQCRYRSCDNPQPMNGGADCEGTAVEVTNCTTHGGWTDWSPWSGCSVTCGVGHRSRSRQCANPVPTNGGRPCSGAPLEETVCAEDTVCPGAQPEAQDGSWTSWSEWTECSSTCGGGIQRRQRVCSDPPPHNGGLPCVGNDLDLRECNTDKCPAPKPRSVWSKWSVYNVTGEYVVQERSRYICRFRNNQLDLSTRTNTRTCSGNSKCGSQANLNTVSIDGQWSTWTHWTLCSEPCGGGVQQRRRYCNSPMPSGNGMPCHGHGLELKQCNVHSCQGEWTCFSEFSPCSRSCGTGIQKRIRVCRASAPGQRYTKECQGPAYEQQSCSNADCEEEQGWGEWTKWSLCTPQNVQLRKRSCDLAFPSEKQCMGPVREERMCFPENNSIEERLAAPALAKSGSDYKLLHILVVGILAFLLGAIIAVGIFLYCLHRREDKRATEAAYNTIRRQDAKPNLYVSPSELNIQQQNQINMNNQNKSYNTASLGRHFKDNQKLTVKEATLKRNSLMRTDLSLNDL